MGEFVFDLCITPNCWKMIVCCLVRYWARFFVQKCRFNIILAVTVGQVQQLCLIMYLGQFTAKASQPVGCKHAWQTGKGSRHRWLPSAFCLFRCLDVSVYVCERAIRKRSIFVEILNEFPKISPHLDRICKREYHSMRCLIDTYRVRFAGI